MGEIWAAVWALPTPADVFVAPFAALALAFAWAVVTATRNVAQLGPLWAACYWLAVIGLLYVGAYGRRKAREVFKGGEDVAAFDPRSGRSGWLGLAGRVVGLVALARAWDAATWTMVGTVGPVVLLAVGLLWWWLLPIFLLLALYRWWALQPKWFEQ
jgi:hypothetical protein